MYVHQAVANELGLNFISVKGPELLSMVGSLVLSSVLQATTVMFK